MTTIHLALRKSTRSYYEDREYDHHEHIIDADTDIDALRDRVNAYYAKPDVMQYQRGQKLVIPAGEATSNVFRSNGGGCDYSMYIILRRAPSLR